MRAPISSLLPWRTSHPRVLCPVLHEQVHIQPGVEWCSSGILQFRGWWGRQINFSLNRGMDKAMQPHQAKPTTSPQNSQAVSLLSPTSSTVSCLQPSTPSPKGYFQAPPSSPQEVLVFLSAYRGCRTAQQCQHCLQHRYKGCPHDEGRSGHVVDQYRDTPSYGRGRNSATQNILKQGRDDVQAGGWHGWAVGHWTGQDEGYEIYKTSQAPCQ